MCPPTAHVFILFSELNFAQTIWDKSEVLLGRSGGNNLRTWGTCWEHVGNKGKNKEILPPPKKTGPFMSLLIGHMKLLFPKLFVTIFGLG
jgi:hypothetical protein